MAKGQTAVEYLIIIGGAALIVAIVLGIIASIEKTQQYTIDVKYLNSMCITIPQENCGCTMLAAAKDPDGPATKYVKGNCVWDTPTGRCIGAIPPSGSC